MDTMSAYALGELHRDDPIRVFDWHKAAQLIKDKKPEVAAAGLRDDWEWTGGDIFENGEPATERTTYLASCWAIPEIELDGIREECWIFQKDSPEWCSDTFWPESALAILKA
jgi:hypothetical protein